MTDTKAETIRALRSFNRFHSRHFGMLTSSYMGSGLSLAQGRILFELDRRGISLASDIQDALGLDAGYLSRTISGMEKAGLISRSRGQDGRQRPIALTPLGRERLDRLDTDVRRHVADSIAHLSGDEQQRLREAAATMARLLGKGAAEL